MAGHTFNEEFACAVAPHRLFHGLYLDGHNLMPKIMPEVKSIDFISGDGGPGSIQQVNFIDGYPVKYIKNRLDFEDKETCAIKYAGIESDAFGDQIDCATHEVKFDATPDGGSICKIKTTFIPKGNVVIGEELLKAGREGYMEKFPVFIAHLTENPHLYA
ncbi:hypothetical protein C5167_012057 [Papaver somniferum]|uniref:Bet v I/Major latex protein domain-containing protein n=1 Tax=Papaver somniferum TaxID=3469 RepID=A0A4Y7IZL7_PAPSO|nr:pathogenesis-related protein STH-2-like [Papaver somniferum]RZC53202.1 hypothetical protein C5167_012057 [Papaver somniferum]